MSLPFHGVTVVEVGGGIAGAFAGKLLAEYGADVIVVEPPSGDTARHDRLGPGSAASHYTYLGGGKQSVVLDLDAEDGREHLLRLACGADILLDTLPAGTLARFGLEPATSAPSLVVCSVTPFGQRGPRTAWRPSSLTAAASGGQMWLTGEEGRPPMKMAGHQAFYQAGLHAFAAVASVLYAARRTGIGEWIDISVQDVQAIALEFAGPAAMVTGVDTGRLGNLRAATAGIYPSADGFVGLVAGHRQVSLVFETLGLTDLAGDERFSTPRARLQHNEELTALFASRTSRLTSAEIVARAEKVHAPLSQILSVAQVLDTPALRDTGFWCEVADPDVGTYLHPAGPIIIGSDRGRQRPSPRLGEYDAALVRQIELRGSSREPGERPVLDAPDSPPLPLAGVRILDLTRVWAGPFATKLLADMGADVIKVEGPRAADQTRFLGSAGPSDGLYNQVPYFNEYNRMKRGIALDLGHPDGLEAFLQLVRSADVVINNWRPGVADKLGIGHERLCAHNPQIISVGMPGFGLHPSEVRRPAYGVIIEQSAGLTSLQGYEGGVPQKSGIAYGDPVAGITAAAAVAMALIMREQSGRDCTVTVPQRDGVIHMIGEFFIAHSLGIAVPLQPGNRDRHHWPQGVYPGAAPMGGEAWLALTVDSDAAWTALVDLVRDPALAVPELATAAGRRAHRETVDAALAAWSARRAPADSAEALQAVVVAAAPVLSPLELTRDEHLQTRGLYRTYEHPEAGRRVCTGPVWRLHRRGEAPIVPAPCFGQHTRAVLRDVAGYADSEIDGLEQRGVISYVPLSA